MHENELAKVVVNVAYRVHKSLGPGLLESVYQAVMVHELRKQGFQIKAKHPVPVVWESIRIDLAFQADIIVEDKLILELKSVEEIARVHRKQLLTYLRLTNCRLGLLINFGSELIKDGISRVVNRLED
jgi:GxxExxY protein